jgi:hypothetical protein
MKRFLLGFSAFLLMTVMGFAQPTVRPAPYNGNNGPRLERVARHRRHRQKHYKNHHRRARRHNNHPHA